MAVSVPNALALGVIADGAPIVASDHRNNYAAAQVGVNGLIAMFTVAPTKGDLIVSAGGGSFDRLPVGATGQVIVADSTQPLGMKWGGGAQRYVTLVDLVSSAAETDILQAAGYAIPANALGASGIARATLEGDYLNNTGGNTTLTLRVYFGGTKIWDGGVSPNVGSGTARLPFRMVFELSNLTAASQALSGVATLGNGTPATTGIGALSNPAPQMHALFGVSAPAAIDTTLAQTLRVTAQLSSSAATHELRIRSSVIEFL